MKKILLMLAMALPIAFASCSDDGDKMKTIKNLTGTTWYDTQVWFMESTEAESMTGYQEVGDVAVGESCTVESESAYFYVYAKDARGRMIMSQPKPLDKSVYVGEDDLF